MSSQRLQNGRRTADPSRSGAGSQQVEYCTQCGSEIQPDQAFCIHCGTRASRQEGPGDRLEEARAAAIETAEQADRLVAKTADRARRTGSDDLLEWCDDVAPNIEATRRAIEEADSVSRIEELESVLEEKVLSKLDDPSTEDASGHRGAAASRQSARGNGQGNGRAGTDPARGGGVKLRCTSCGTVAEQDGQAFCMQCGDDLESSQRTGPSLAEAREDAFRTLEQAESLVDTVLREGHGDEKLRDWCRKIGTKIEETRTSIEEADSPERVEELEEMVQERVIEELEPRLETDPGRASSKGAQPRQASRSSSRADPTSESQFCTHCGDEASPDQAFCTGCGAQLTAGR